jgi:hypothetical protein
MARLRDGEKSSKEGQVQQKLGKHFFGIREAEMAEELGWDRRTLNNYLRAQEQQGRAYREGRSWFIEVG